MTNHPETSIRYQELPPDEELASYLVGFWQFSVDSLAPAGYDHTIPPDGCVSLMIRYACSQSTPWLLLLGPRTTAHCVRMNELQDYYGFRLWPHTCRAVLQVEPESLVDAVGPAQQWVPRFAERVRPPEKFDPAACQKSLGDAVVAGLAVDQIDTDVATAVKQIVIAQGDIAIGDVASHLKIGVRSLQRRFKRETGLGPKQFARLRRFRAAAIELSRTENKPWATIAYHTGFSDQAHLAREFTQIVGLTAEQLRNKLSVIDHQDVS